jgi:hypothetical protein
MYPDGVEPMQGGIALALNISGKLVRGRLCSWSCMMRWLEEKVLTQIAIDKLAN